MQIGIMVFRRLFLLLERQKRSSSRLARCLCKKCLGIVNELTVKADSVERNYVGVLWEEMVKDPNTKDLGEMFAFYTDYDTQCIPSVESNKEIVPGAS